MHIICLLDFSHRIYLFACEQCQKNHQIFSCSNFGIDFWLFFHYFWTVCVILSLTVCVCVLVYGTWFTFNSLNTDCRAMTVVDLNFIHVRLMPFEINSHCYLNNIVETEKNQESNRSIPSRSHNTPLLHRFLSRSFLHSFRIEFWMRLFHAFVVDVLHSLLVKNHKTSF